MKRPCSFSAEMTGQNSQRVAALWQCGRQCRTAYCRITPVHNNTHTSHHILHTVALW